MPYAIQQCIQFIELFYSMKNVVRKLYDIYYQHNRPLSGLVKYRKAKNIVHRKILMWFMLLMNLKFLLVDVHNKFKPQRKD